MENKPHYTEYENRYQKVYEAGIERWGYMPDDEVLVAALTLFVNENHLQGKKIIEFDCGEGACGQILSELGCIYHGIDIAPSAIEKAKTALKRYPSATVSLHDMVSQAMNETYDAALDVMGFHMLILDADRAKYLSNAFGCLKFNAPMLFYNESYRENAPTVEIHSLEDWLLITSVDCITPQKRIVWKHGVDKEVFLPLLPARTRTKDGYLAEMNQAGFAVDAFVEMAINKHCVYSASIYVRKPN